MVSVNIFPAPMEMSEAAAKLFTEGRRTAFETISQDVPAPGKKILQRFHGSLPNDHSRGGCNGRE